MNPSILVTDQRQILKTDTVAYYSCRAPDGKCSLVAEPYENGFSDKIALLHDQYNRFLSNLGFDVAHPCNRPECKLLRECMRVSFLPRLINREQHETHERYILDFDCFTFGKLVLARDLADNFCVTVPTAYRLTIGLLILVDRMIRSGIYAELTISNLLIDITSATLTLVDWSKAEVFEIMPLEKSTELCKQVSEIIFQLTRVERNEEGWQSPTGFECDQMKELFDILGEMKYKLQLDAPESLELATEYAQTLSGEMNALTKRAIRSITQVKFETRKPLFEVKRLRGKENG